MTSLRTAVIASICACFAAGANAQSATSYEAIYGAVYEQTSTATKSKLGYNLELGINGVDPSRFNWSAVEYQTWQGDGVYPFNPWLTNYRTKSGLFYFLSDLHDSYQGGGFTFSLGNDGNPEDYGSVWYGADLFSSDVPLLAQYNDLQSLLGGQAFTVNVPGFTPGAGTNDNHTFYKLFDYSSGKTILSGVSADANGFGLNIPQFILEANHDYGLELAYSSGIKVENAGLSGATSYLRYDNRVTTNFHVNAVPEPATMAALGFGALALVRRKRK